MRHVKGLLLLLTATVLFSSGCAHQIEIAPDLGKIMNENPTEKIDKAVGYYISAEKRQLSVTTPAGGGDSVKYNPYLVIEPGFNLILSKIFTAAYRIDDLNDQTFMQEKKIHWVFTPTISTNSSSRNAFFWPPTDFSMTINCIASDQDQAQIWNETVQADGDVIPVSEILKDHGLAGKSAAANALHKLYLKLQAAPEFRR